ncbi:MAG: TetR/AcrR family transcriptional regulator [Bacteroidales bacterium]|nr:TetR/AcrR family transcriptional regulator [Bacteroidales bacterium]
MNKKDNILKAALKLFVEQGEQASSMKWIAKEAKCGIGTMYNYFQSKDELINELYVEIKTKLFTNILEELNHSAPVKQQFVETWLKAMNFAVSNPLEYTFLEIFSHSPKISKQASDEVNELIYPVLEIFEKGKKEGIIKDIDTLQLVIFTNGAITSSILRSPNIDENGKKAIVLMAWDAIKS